MPAEVFDSINKLKKVFEEHSSAFLFAYIPENVSTEVVLKVAKSKRDKMIEILNQFYNEHYQTREGVDDFITLFGVYCNYYILYGLHLILKEDDFGTSKIFENISDDSLKKYLSLIRSGICAQDAAQFEDATKINTNYSLAHFYLFLICLRQYWSSSYDVDKEKELLAHYKAIKNEELRKYAVGRSEFIPRIDNYVIRLVLLFILRQELDTKSLDDFFSPSSYEDQMLRNFIVKFLNETQEKSPNLFAIDVPSLPCPYLLTNTMKQYWGYFGMAFGAYFGILLITKCSKNIFEKDFVKELEEVISFIKDEKIFLLQPDEARSKLLKLFSERKFKPEVKQFIDCIAYWLHACLSDIIENFCNFIKENPSLSTAKHMETEVKQTNLEMAEIYLGEQSSVLELYGDMEEIIDSFKKTPNINSKLMVNRSRFLGIPYEIEWKSQELNILMERISVQSEKDTMVRDFMHTCSNMKADSLYDIAQLLLKRENPEDQKNGRNLLLEYAMKEELSNSVYMMQLMYKNNVDDLKNIIKKDLVGEEDDHENIIDILNKSLLQCLINIFYGNPTEKTGKITKMHENLGSIWGETFFESELRDKFEQQFMEKDFNCLDWLSQEGINFVCKQEPVWEKIFMAKEGHCSTFFKIIFDELCVNVFKYGDLTKKICLYLSEDENKDLVISFENYFTFLRLPSGTQIGLNLLRRRIQILHEDTKINCVELVDDEDKEIFRIKLILPAALFLNYSS